MVLRRVYTTLTQTIAEGAANFLARTKLDMAVGTVADLGRVKAHSNFTTTIADWSHRTSTVFSQSVASRVDGVLGHDLLSSATARTLADLGRPPAVSAPVLKEIRWALTSTQPALTAGNAGSGNNAFTNPSNGTGKRNGTVATHTGQALSATDATLQLTHPTMPNKSSLTITQVLVRYYVRQSGTTLNNGSMSVSFKGVAKGTFTGDVDYLTTPFEVDVTSQIGGSWANLQSATSAVQHVTSVAQLHTVTVDAVEIIVTASMVQSQSITFGPELLSPSQATGTDDLNTVSPYHPDGNAWSSTRVVYGSSTDQSHSGSKSLLVYRDAASPGNNDAYVALGNQYGMKLGMQAGKTYRFSGWAMFPTGSVPTNSRAPVTIFWKLSGGAYAEATPVGGVSIGAWFPFSVDFTIPAGSTEAFVRLYNGYANDSEYASGGARVYYDDMSLMEVINP